MSSKMSSKMKGFIIWCILISLFMCGCGKKNTDKKLKCGSADNIEGKTMVITVAVGKGGDIDGSDYEIMMENYAKAFDYISQQSEDYGRECSFVFSNGDSKNYPAKADLSLDFEGDDMADFIAYDYDSLMKEEADKYDKLRRHFEADNVLYAFLIDGSGESFSAYHWSEDGDNYYQEGCFVFLNNTSGDINGSSLYVKRILSVYGGFSLENPEPTFGYDRNLCDLVSDKYSFDIMFNTDYTKEADEFEITDITAYLLGLSDDFEEIGEYPLFVQPVRRGYTDRFDECYGDGSEY